MSIENFKHKGLKELFLDDRTSKIDIRQHKPIIFILDLIAAAADLTDLVGAKGYHALVGDRKGTYAMTVTKNYRVTFKWNGKDVYDVNYEDYH